MRSARPSGKAVLAAGSIAMTLVVVATSGAVAGALITSDDIADNTIRSRDIKDDTVRSRDLRTDAVTNSDIRAGAVNWDKSLDQATKDLISGLAQSGAAGPPGAPGAQGPAGPQGPPGPAGSNATGSQLAAWALFDTATGDDVPLTIANPLEDPDNPDDDSVSVDLTGLEPAAGAVRLAAGSYLVTLRSLSPTLGVWVPQVSTSSLLSDSTPSMGVCLSLFLPCESTFPVIVPPGGADLQVFLGDVGGLCGCDTADPVVSMSAVSLATGAGVTVPADLPDLPDIVGALVIQIVSMLEGLLGGPPDPGFRAGMRQLQRHYGP